MVVLVNHTVKTQLRIIPEGASSHNHGKERGAKVLKVQSAPPPALRLFLPIADWARKPLNPAGLRYAERRVQGIGSWEHHSLLRPKMRHRAPKKLPLTLGILGPDLT